MYLHCKTHNWKQVGGLRGQKEKQQQFYGYMSSLAYKSPEDRTKGLAKHGFLLDTQLSNPDIMVAHNPKTNEIIHSIAGSRFTDTSKFRGRQNRFRDISSDIGILTGTSSLGKRQKEIDNVISASQKKYGKTKDYVNTGHSLAGRLAIDNSKKTGIPAISYNAGSSPLGALSSRIANLFKKDKKAERVHYTTGTDFISKSEQLLGDTKTIVVPPKKGVDATSLTGRHSIKHFTGQDGSGRTERSSCSLRKHDKPPEVPVLRENRTSKHKVSVGAPAGKKKNKWLQHVAKVREKNKDMKYTDVLKLASKSYQS